MRGESPGKESSDTPAYPLPSRGIHAIDGNGWGEKRRHRRVEVRWSSTIRTDDRVLQGEIRNISKGGAFICCKNPPEPGETLWTVIKASNGRRLLATNEVTWLSSNGQESDRAPQGMGVRFLTVSNESRRVIDEVVAVN